MQLSCVLSINRSRWNSCVKRATSWPAASVTCPPTKTIGMCRGHTPTATHGHVHNALVHMQILSLIRFPKHMRKDADRTGGHFLTYQQMCYRACCVWTLRVKGVSLAVDFLSLDWCMLGRLCKTSVGSCRISWPELMRSDLLWRAPPNRSRAGEAIPLLFHLRDAANVSVNAS